MREICMKLVFTIFFREKQVVEIFRNAVSSSLVHTITCKLSLKVTLETG